MGQFTVEYIKQGGLLVVLISEFQRIRILDATEDEEARARYFLEAGLGERFAEMAFNVYRVKRDMEDDRTIRQAYGSEIRCATVEYREPAPADVEFITAADPMLMGLTAFERLSPKVTSGWNEDIGEKALPPMSSSDGDLPLAMKGAIAEELNAALTCASIRGRRRLVLGDRDRAARAENLPSPEDAGPTSSCGPSAPKASVPVGPGVN